MYSVAAEATDVIKQFVAEWPYAGFSLYFFFFLFFLPFSPPPFFSRHRTMVKTIKWSRLWPTPVSSEMCYKVMQNNR